LSGTFPITKNIESKFNYDSFLNSNPTMTESSTTIHERNAVARIEDEPTTTQQQQQQQQSRKDKEKK